MIYNLRKKFIVICTISFFSVFAVMISAIFIMDTLHVNKIMDSLADFIFENGGHFPERDEKSPPENHRFVNSDPPFTTRFFTVSTNENGEIDSVDVSYVSELTEEDAVQYAEDVMSCNKERGWYGNFRYCRYESDGMNNIVFVSGSTVKDVFRDSIVSTAQIFGAGSLAVMFLIVVLSGFAVRTAAESYEKQKQFITDASHELKTPLTLILANVDIAESELGNNEWLDDIRIEGEHMSKLVNQMVTLTRMDETVNEEVHEETEISAIAEETVSEFSDLSQMLGKMILSDIQPGVKIKGNSSEIRQLFSILLDNAVKYCDDKGIIRLELCQNRHVTIRVYNTYKDVDSVSFNRLFDRFYRADQARTAGSGFGIGLSIAKSVVSHHRGSIKAFKSKENEICFQVKL